MSIQSFPITGPASTENNTSFTVFKQDGSHQFYCRWTAEEDMLLAKAVADHGPHKWTLVSKLIPGRTAVQCSTRWFGALNPNVHKGRWSKMEDDALTEAVQYFQMITPNDGTLPWNKIAENIPHRTGIQCQARWTEALDPAVRKGRWHPDEDAQLKAAIAKYGCCWIRVASMIPTRTQRQCRTRWNQIHSQQLKANAIQARRKSSNVASHGTLNNMMSASKYNQIKKYEFMPPTFPNDTSIMIKRESTSHEILHEDPCLILTTTSPTIDDIILSSSSSISSPSSLSMSPTSPIYTMETQQQQQSNVLQHENNELVDFFPIIMNNQTSHSKPFQFNKPQTGTFLNNADFDFLLNCFGN